MIIHQFFSEYRMVLEILYLVDFIARRINNLHVNLPENIHPMVWRTNFCDNIVDKFQAADVVESFSVEFVAVTQKKNFLGMNLLARS